jgi:Ca2+-dependent lipid-binding protein
VHDPTKGLINKTDNDVNRLFSPGRVQLTGHLITFKVFRAEHLAPLDIGSNSIDAYVKISFAGNKAESKAVKSNRNPEFNQELKIACSLPTMNDTIKIEIWDDDMIKDERVGTYYIKFSEI